MVTSTDSGLQGLQATEIVQEAVLEEVPEFDRGRGHGGVCVGEDVAGADTAAVST